MAKDEQKNSITLSKEDMNSLIEQIKAEAIAEIKAEADSTKSAEEQEAAKKKAEEDAYWNELVPLRLFKDGKDYKDDVFVAVGSERYAIKRGVEVQVPRKIRAVIENAEEQNIAAAEYAAARQQEYREASVKYNL